MPDGDPAAVIRVRTDLDAAEASRAARLLAEELGFGPTAAVQVATAVSEVAMNIVRHADGTGTVTVRAVEGEGGAGVVVEARDEGPGIADLDAALGDGFSTGGSLGLGLPGARRLVDEFRVESAPGSATVVRLVKWSLPQAPEPGRLAAWAIAGPADDTTPVVKSFPGGLLLAVVEPPAAARLRADPERAVTAFLDSGMTGAVAVLSARDGVLSWTRTGCSDAVRVPGAIAGPRPVQAPLRRASTGVVHRGDWVVLSSRALDLTEIVPRLAGGPGRVAAAAAEPDATAVAAHLLRGALERPARS